MIMSDKDIGVHLMINEPTFVLGGKQYSVCCPVPNEFSTWDSDGNTLDFQNVTSLLDSWIVNGKPFRDVVKEII